MAPTGLLVILVIQIIEQVDVAPIRAIHPLPEICWKLWEN
jgi:hypothetical protein